MWLPGGASSTGAGIIAKEFDHGELAQLNQAALLSEPTGLSVYPLFGKGERFPFSHSRCGRVSPLVARIHNRCDTARFSKVLHVLSDSLLMFCVPGCYLSTEASLFQAVQPKVRRSTKFERISCKDLLRFLQFPKAPLRMAILVASSTSSLQTAAQRMVSRLARYRTISDILRLRETVLHSDS